MSPSPCSHASSPFYTQHRSISFGALWKKWRGKKDEGVAAELDDPQIRKKFLQKTSERGSIASDNIFNEEIKSASDDRDSADLDNKSSKLSEEMQARKHFSNVPRTHENTAIVLDPDPASRIRWLRKKVIQMVRNPNSVTPEQRIRALERECTHSSHFMATSTKKLCMLSRQIAGMPVDKAIDQMRWSKKKYSKEILYYLEEARDLAIAKHGMGLGKVNGELFKEPRKILTKDGKWISISDPTRIYIAQSWVGRGGYLLRRPDRKGRGRIGTISRPSTKITFILKEEKTRIRECAERDAKKAAKGPWVHHPNRSLIGQRPYYSW
ncbi:hypothetical protein CDD81_6 [Ophiocordyceps australis]|uniref:54S ribosomal protein L22, mitochondrial n=1 Tax=Ophiocordyceps australis TaxID=1399860 RepID=A0A2C5XND1_9HYPO|nr:hypothetical protein CDD81_6 [Ophiocordyceps australis]